MKTSAVQPPLLGLGTFHNRREHDKVAAAVKEAIKNGYRHFDLAKAYENEAEVGAAIRECIAEGIVSRDDLYICTKLWMTDCAPEDVEPALRGSLERLGMDYVDNFMMHWPCQWTKDSTYDNFKTVHMGDVASLLKTYTAMEALVEAGLTRSLGVSNFDETMLTHLVQNCRILPRTHEFEMHPYLQQNTLMDLSRSHDIQCVAYSPLGKLGNAKEVDGQPVLLRDSTILNIAAALGRTPAQVLLRWAIQRGACVIPKSVTDDHIKDNADILDWRLSDTDMAEISKLNRNHRYVDVEWYDFDMNRSRSRAVSHPDLVNQPLMKPGETDNDGLYKNSFGREGRPLHSDIFVKRGVMQELEFYADQFLPSVSLTAKNYVVIDEIVDSIIDADKTFVAALGRAGVDCEKIVVPSSVADDAGETSTEPYKNNDVFNNCVSTILEHGVSKHTCIISVGGGVVNNLCGVLAGLIYRGIHLIHFTTTTMGMLDAALDFKQAINHDLGKNLIGVYYPASKIIIDPDCVKSLSTRHIRNGIAEGLKHAICQSVELTEKIVEPVRKHGEKMLHDSEYIEEICKLCIEIKAPTLDHYHESDFNEMCPQYGHAVGHAVESLSWTHSHEPLLHGEAVAIGMCVSAEIALMRGLCDQETVDKHYDAVLAVGLPAYVPATMTTDMIMKKLIYDKHYVKVPTMGLTAKIGEMAFDRENNSFSFAISNEELLRAIDINMEKAMFCVPC